MAHRIWLGGARAGRGVVPTTPPPFRPVARRSSAQESKLLSVRVPLGIRNLDTPTCKSTLSLVVRLRAIAPTEELKYRWAPQMAITRPVEARDIVDDAPAAAGGAAEGATVARRLLSHLGHASAAASTESDPFTEAQVRGSGADLMGRVGRYS